MIHVDLFTNINKQQRLFIASIVAIVCASALMVVPAHADWMQRMLQFDVLTLNKATDNSRNQYDAQEFSSLSVQPKQPFFRFANFFGTSRPQLSLLPYDLSNRKERIESAAIAASYDALSMEPNMGFSPIIETVIVEAGSSLYAILEDFGINAVERQTAAEAINKEFLLRKLQAGWSVRVGYNAAVSRGDKGRLLSVNFNPTSFESINLSRESEGFVVSAQKDEIADVTIRYAGTIEHGLWQDLKNKGFSDRMIAKLNSALSKRINTKKDIKPGANYEFVMDVKIRENGQVTESERILYASIEVGDFSKRAEQDLTKEIYYFSPPRARTSWYTPSARSVSSGMTLWRRPAKGRISSHFNPRRKNPITGKTSPHNGVDIAAPKGTPIMAAGDGTIVQRKTYGSYGKFIEIDHGGGWKTRYAHMSSYKSGVTRGTFVRQGQVIGFVGSTGRSTGNHLHYEILKNGKARDPIRASLPERIVLTGADKTAFNRFKNKITTLREIAPVFGEDVFYKRMNDNG